jgi:uncharacterized protein GlcG (DUF336 family)
MYQLSQLSPRDGPEEDGRTRRGDSEMISRRNCGAGLSLLLLAACSGGSNPALFGADQAGTGCAGSCTTAASLLTVTDVQEVLSQAVSEAQARGAKATVAVVDRVGNVLAVYRMGTAADRGVIIATATDSAGHAVIHGGLEGIRLPSPAAPVNIDDQAAIAKAITGAFLSSEGNAFSSRTASQIVQDHFNPGERNQPGGPLFGVQFSQLACSDFMGKSSGTATTVGPQRSPLGLSADPGGFPLYKGGALVGGVGVMADGVYGIDADITDVDMNLDEAIAYAATYNFAAAADIRADAITVDGKTLRFSDITAANLATDPARAAAFPTLDATVGNLIPVNGYSDGTIRAGTVFGDPASGIRPDAGTDFPGQTAFVFVDANNAPRFEPRAGADGPAALTEAEVRQLLRSALDVANRARAQIRLPLGSQARVTIAIVDTLGNPLGMVRSADAAVFGADVSLQKARSATFFSSADAAAYLTALPAARYLVVDSGGLQVSSVALDSYVAAFRGFMGDPGSLSNDNIAYSDRAIGNLSRPYFPDGIDGAPAGPLSKPKGAWSVFSSGLQLDMSINSVLQHVLATAGAGVPDVAPGCTGIDLATDLSSVTRVNTDVRLGNGLQIFPGSVPIYRGAVLVGGIGVSGDGVDQDDMVAFLGLANASTALGGALSNAPAARRADTLSPQGTRLRFVQCPQAPFNDNSAENVCAGL